MFDPEEYVAGKGEGDPLADAIGMLQTAQSVDAEERMIAVSAVIDLLTKMLNGPTQAEADMPMLPLGEALGQGAKQPGYVPDEIGQNPGSLAAPSESDGDGIPMEISELPKAPANSGNNKRLSAELETKTYGGKISG